MMIHKDDVRSTLRAWDPETTGEAIDSLYERMEDEWQEGVFRLITKAEKAFKKKTGHPMDGMTRMRIIPQAKQVARDLVYGEYLEPINQAIAERNAAREFDEE